MVSITPFRLGTLLAPGNRMVIGASEFENGTALSNGGELLKLEDASRGTISEFRYDDRGPVADLARWRRDKSDSQKSNA